ncbi:8-oxo-dGTP diphosphatase [Candidatus Bathyarchaeota archaeon]|nr:MAG: 8-oxo-dGTP diphosphatase [Candidatus Bathyarchaeota archaeon]TMI53355.1 MAG: 8-oxo-dGTP diphosphatase [Candidatus Bathyarchaeota archaeon]
MVQLTIHATLCFIIHNNRVLLLKKNPELFGAGKWNAPGGKLQPKETAEQCASREVYEETGLKVQKPRKIGTLVFFKYNKREDPDWIAHVFLTKQFHGTIKEGKEGILQWYPIDRPPLDEMWKDDKYWYQYAVEGRSFRGDFYFRGDFEKLVDHRIELL